MTALVSSASTTMPRKLVRRFLPSHAEVVRNRFLRPFSALLHDPALLAVHRRSVAKATALGLFWSVFPMPLQAVPAVLMAAWLRVNVLVALVAVWITNPLTTPFVILGQYKLGNWLLSTPETPRRFEIPEFEFSAAWGQAFLAALQAAGPAFLLGVAVSALLLSALGYLAVNTAWLLAMRTRFNRRQRARGATRLKPGA